MDKHKLICFAAHEFLRRFPRCGEEIDDLINEGYAELPEIEAKYERSPRKNVISLETFLVSSLTYHYLDKTRPYRSHVLAYTDNDNVIESLSGSLIIFPPRFLKRLSTNAQAFLDAVCTMPPALERYLQAGNHKYMPFKYGVGTWMGLSFDDVEQIRAEILKKLLS